MDKPVKVTVEAINEEYGYTLVEIKAPNAQPMSFAIRYRTETGKYDFDQTGENNRWEAWPDERK